MACHVACLKKLNALFPGEVLFIVLPPNSTAFLQPADHGIIKKLKDLLRREVAKIVLNLDKLDKLRKEYGDKCLEIWSNSLPHSSVALGQIKITERLDLISRINDNMDTDYVKRMFNPLIRYIQAFRQAEEDKTEVTELQLKKMFKLESDQTCKIMTSRLTTYKLKEEGRFNYVKQLLESVQLGSYRGDYMSQKNLAMIEVLVSPGSTKQLYNTMIDEFADKINK